MNFLRKYRITVVICIIYTLVILLVTLNRFWQYEAFYYDHGIYDMAIWKASRLRAPIIEHLSVPSKWELADHFNPSIFLLVPLYWLTDKQEIILIAQAFMIGISVVFAYLIAEKLITNRLMRLALLASFMGFVGLQNALIANFHDVTFMILPLLVMVWSALSKKWKLYWLFFIITLGSRETAALIGFGLGFYLFFKGKAYKKQAVMTMLISLIYGFLILKILIGKLFGIPFLYQPAVPGNPLNWLVFLVYPWIKLKTIIISLASFGFLPLLYPPMYPVILQDYVMRFVLNTGSARWDLGLHYNATISPLLFIAACEAVKMLEKKIVFRKIANVFALTIVIIVILFHHFLHGPFGLVYNFEFYRHTGRQKFMDDFIAVIPKKGKIMAPNNIAVRLTHYDVILPRGNYEDYDPEVIVIDLREGQNANNFWPLSEPIVKDLKNKLSRDKNYKDIYNDPNRSIFVKNI